MITPSIKLEAVGMVRDIQSHHDGFQFYLDVNEGGRHVCIPCYMYNTSYLNVVQEGLGCRIEARIVFDGGRTRAELTSAMTIPQLNNHNSYQRASLFGIIKELDLVENADHLKVCNMQVEALVDGQAQRIPCQAWRGAGVSAARVLKQDDSVRLEGRMVFNGERSYVEVKRYHVLSRVVS